LTQFSHKFATVTRDKEGGLMPSSKIIHLPNIPKNKKIFFASDFHLGVPNYLSTKDREKQVVAWLDSIQSESHALFLLGDIFDFWFEYKHVIPKGFLRLQAKLASFTEAGIPVYLIVGNHDCWIKDYFTKELNLQVFDDNITLLTHDKKFLIGHGDELGGSKTYLLLKKYIYRSNILSWICRNLPPSIVFSIASYASRSSRRKTKLLSNLPPQDFIFEFCKEMIEPLEHHDYYVFGHLHFPYSKLINDASIYFNVGDWITHFSYGTFNGAEFELENAY
jgi:UDP-2,3-diacylglucosamine hydrolase